MLGTMQCKVHEWMINVMSGKQTKTGEQIEIKYIKKLIQNIILNKLLILVCVMMYLKNVLMKCV